MTACSTSLTSKGLRPINWFKRLLTSLAAPPWLQRDWDFSASHSFANDILAAPPWLQRDWDFVWVLRLARYFLQHLPDFKGIETNAYTGDKYDLCLQHLPDFKGIETLVIDWIMVILLLQHLPDFKGIETVVKWMCSQWWSCSTSLTSKGLRLWSADVIRAVVLAAPPWLQRDWDSNGLPGKIFLILQHLPGFKGIETHVGSRLPPHLSCSTSLTSKGLRHRVFVIIEH